MEVGLLKALIFDFDGLILDTETPDMHIWQEIYSSNGQLLSLQTWGQIVGGTGNSTFDPASHLENLLGHPIDRDAINLFARNSSEEASLNQSILPGVETLLETGRNEGLKLAIASSSPHLWVDTHLKRLGLFGYFEAILCGDDVTRTKPHPDLYQAALHSLKVQAKEAVVFEDSPNGIQAAKTAGIFTVAVPNPTTLQLGVDQADLVFSSLESISLDALRVSLG
jgi:HAD superfamily hydrolase (TIGR01509 family)